MSFYVYILKCKNNKLYTGYTKDLQQRLTQHNNGSGAKYTRSHSPCSLVYSEEFETRSLAMRREREIKKLSREQKLNAIEKKKQFHSLVITP